MKTFPLLLSLCLSSIFTFAQSQNKVDLSKPPASAPATATKSNAQLLKESNQPGNYDTVNLAEKYKTDPNAASPVIMRKDAAERVNGTTSQEFNIGNTKATNTILYDETGKIKSSGTSIELGKKK